MNGQTICSCAEKSQHYKNVNCLLICKFKGKPIKIPTGLLTELDKRILNSTWKNKSPQVAQSILQRTKVEQTCCDHIDL